VTAAVLHIISVSKAHDRTGIF